MYFGLRSATKKSYLQLFPFSKISSDDCKYLASEDFFSKYIRTGGFVAFPNTLYQTENYIQKGDGSFRNSSLISPILYLVLQAVGKEISEKYVLQRPNSISIYYAGNYLENRPIYKQDYDNFFKEINGSIEQYQYFIKTDISNFYSSINLDKLIRQIDCVCNQVATVFTQTHLLLYRRLLQFCGAGKFPLIENSIASSYLATVIYLDPIDKELHDFIKRYIDVFQDFKMIRYVDDLYILLSSDKPVELLHETFNEIRNEYSSILKKYDLSLNAKKCCIKPTVDINKELKKSLYDEFFNGEKCNIEHLFNGALLDFIKDIEANLVFDAITVEQYNSLIEEHFYKDDIEFTPNEVLNYFIYENQDELRSPDVIESITQLVKHDVSFISLDPKRLTVMIMETHSELAIKTFLNHLFNRYRAGKWNSYDTTIAIAYLIQSRFRHIDLLNIIRENVPSLYEYYRFCCKSSFCTYLQGSILQKIISDDSKTYFLYFMYLVEKQRNDYLAAFAYYKNYFDRLSAHFAYYTKYDNNGKKPNYKRFYKEGELKKLYSSIPGGELVIHTAHDLRNANPLSHASADLIDNEKTSDNLSDSISAMQAILKDFLNNLSV